MPTEPTLLPASLLTLIRPPRSGGVRVSKAVSRLIATGDAARDRRAWTAAAEAYAAALAQAPGLAHIWVQRGHALKEDGQIALAASCYARASELDPGNADPHLHLGHAAKLRGDRAMAARHYLRSAQLHPASADGLAELRTIALKDATMNPDALHSLFDDLDALTDLGRDELALASPDPVAADERRPCTVFDVSDLIAYFNHNRTPSGIQRVQLETLAEALDNSAFDVRICAFHQGRDAWIELARAHFLELSERSGAGSEAAWTTCLTKLRLRLVVAPVFRFPTGAVLVNLGTSWWIPNYFMFVRRAKAEAGICYVPFVHDLIPLVTPDLCPPALVQDFTAWILDVLEHADFYLVNSRSTKRDLMAIAAYLERPVGDERIEVVPLDAAPTRAGTDRADPAALGRMGLRRGGYVLMVSTIEPRKNHIRMFEAWSRLIERHGAAAVPRLICVGNAGWMNQPIHDHLADRPDLQDRIRILTGVTDADLAPLYRGCLFVLYPSRYEGWGLPVTEALTHGKVPLCSNVSSIPEAGGGFADYFDLETPSDLVTGLERLIYDDDYRRSRERLIAESFRPRSWRAVADHILARSVPRPDLLSRVDTPPRAESGRYHGLKRSPAARVWPGLRSTDRFRAGPGWWGQESWGCWTRPGGATLRFLVPDATRAHRAYLDLLAMPDTQCRLRIEGNGRERPNEIILEPKQRAWVSVDLPGLDTADGALSIDLICSTFEDLDETTGGNDPRAIAVGVAGFYLCEESDMAARLRLIEAITLSEVDRLAINQPPAGHVSLGHYLDGRHDG